jgi:ubiquinone/menaquinone biosynthesis C-methylase UbiE
MSADQLKEYFERTSERFSDPSFGMSGRDLVVYPFLDGLSGTLLDYGCGAGSLLIGLAREERFSTCFGVDISEKALAIAAQAWNGLQVANKDKLKLITARNDLLPDIPDRSIDAIVSAASIAFVINPYVVLDELHRIARNNAVLVCCVPNYAYFKHIIQLMFGVQPRTGTNEPVENWRTAGWDGMHIHTFTKSSFSILLNDCGWKPEKWTGWGNRFGWLGFGKLRRQFPGLLSGELVVACRKL